MKQFILLPAFLLYFTLMVSSQDFIGLKKAAVESGLRQRYGKLVKPEQYKDTVRLEVTTGTYSPAEYIYSFNEKGICMGETIITRCDSCYSGLLKLALDKKKFQWKKINENQYISRYEERCMIEIFPDEKERSFSVLRVDWNKEVYEMLLKN